MKVTVQVKPHSKKETVEALADGSYVVRVNVAPIEGKANERVIELLAKILKKPKSSIKLISGQRGKRKVFEITP